MAERVTPHGRYTGWHISLQAEREFCTGARKLQEDSTLDTADVLDDGHNCRYCGCQVPGYDPPFPRRIFVASHTPHDDHVARRCWCHYKCSLCDTDQVFSRLESFEEHLKTHLRDGTPLCLERMGHRDLMLLSKLRCPVGEKCRKLHA